MAKYEIETTHSIFQLHTWRTTLNWITRGCRRRLDSTGCCLDGCGTLATCGDCCGAASTSSTVGPLLLRLAVLVTRSSYITQSIISIIGFILINKYSCWIYFIVSINIPWQILNLTKKNISYELISPFKASRDYL